MMRKLFLGICLMAAVSLQAQKIVKGAGGEIILDCSEMNASRVESVKNKKCIGGTASGTTYRDGSTTTDPYASENDKVYVKLEIDKANLNLDWVTAYNTCKGKGTGWRLPTQRELILIWIFREAILQCGGANFSETPYWSATENNSRSEMSWYVHFGTSTVYSTRKEYSYGVRCVKEL